MDHGLNYRMSRYIMLFVYNVLCLQRGRSLAVRQADAKVRIRH